MEIEWSWMQQIAFLMYSIPVGIVLGILLNVFNGFERLMKIRLNNFILDVAFAILSAVITFLSALVITDGQIHPVLFIGQLLGFLLVHYFCGKYISKCIYQLCKFLIKVVGCCRGLLSHICIITKNAAKCTVFKTFIKKILEIFS